MQTSSHRWPRHRAVLAVAVAALGFALAALPAGAGKPDVSGMSFSQTPLTGKIIWNDLITDDLDATRTFYGALFGWTFEHSSGKGGRYVLARSGNTYVAGIVEVKTKNRNEKISRWLPYVSVDNVDGAISVASAKIGRAHV